MPGGFQGKRVRKRVADRIDAFDVRSDRPRYRVDILHECKLFHQAHFLKNEVVEAAGHHRVPLSYKTKDGFKLGLWVANQRHRRDVTSGERQQRLEMLKGWSWDPLSDAWEEGYRHLEGFCDIEGHCRVRQTYKTKDGYRLPAEKGKC
jgi:hypothetical protein